MAPVWEAIRQRLETRGVDNRGRIGLPPLDAASRRTLAALIDRPPTAQVDLARVEAGLVRLGVGHDLLAALAALGFTVSLETAQRRAEVAAGRAARAAARAEAATWPEPWAEEWIEAVVRSGGVRRLDREAAVGLVRRCRRVLDAVDQRAARADAPLSRTDLAAQLLGDAHALDTGSRLEVAVSRALVLRAAPTEARDAWEGAGVHPDLTSGPVLTWNLPLVAGAGLAPVAESATGRGVPVHLTRMALEAHPVRTAPGAEVLVVENPRIVEAAAQRSSPRALVSAGGSPSGAVQLLVRQLLDAGATVRYHGDFDTAGLVLCARMAAIGVLPWRMSADDYRAALVAADADGVTLPVDPSPPPPTPWDPALHDAFASDGRVVHEERLLPGLLDI
jgi:uncharacterized protein (TIGR02679 family)